MSGKLKQRLYLGLKTKLVFVAFTIGLTGTIVFLTFFGFFNTAPVKEAKAYTTETIPAGSFIVNMGVVPQTFSNALKPYGMIYELTNTYNVPVKWVIEPSKAKDGNDFTHNGVTYRGGAFIIPAPFINATVSTVIDTWQTAGVSGNYSVSGMNLPVYMEITSFPLVIIDSLSMNDSIIINYFNNAGIPATAYNKGAPSTINSCHDTWVNPHGDPTWPTHGYLHDFVTTQKSFIWMQCHAVSMMESCAETVAPFRQLNYLTTDGLQCYQAGKCQSNSESHAKAVPGSVAYFHPSDPVMQFLGGISSIASGGSERWFIPKTTGGWLATTKRLITVGTTSSPKEGVQMVYGPAYGDSTNGYVMYMGGHDMNSGSTGDMIAGQRAFFNFLLLAGKQKAPSISPAVAGIINANASDTFTVDVTGGTAPFNYSWTSSAGGMFSDPNADSTIYNSPHTLTPLQTIITCVVTDACGRRSFFSQVLNINASALPITLISFEGKVHQNNMALLNWITGTEKNNDFFTIEKSNDAVNFTTLRNVPSKGNSNNVQYYSTVDETPFAGINFYRLSQTDLDGTREVLKDIKVDFTPSRNKNRISAWPNPFSNTLTVGLNRGEAGTVSIKIRGLQGRVFFEQDYDIDDQTSEITLGSLSQLPRGNYIVTVERNEEVSEGFKVSKY